MRKINHKSDFTLALKLRACKDGKPCGELVEVPFSSHDWEARFWTWSKANFFTASRKGGVNRNCLDDGGRIRVVFDNHGLLAGRLWVEYTEWIPDSTYPDGFRKLVTSQPLDIELVKGPACPPGELEASIVTPQTAGGASAPLPFVFSGKLPEDLATHPVAVYDRSTNMFEAIGGELPDGYNELLEDGTVRASTKAEFRCGNVVYRHTGRELVNTAIERDPNRRLVHRVPSLGAHPGLAYLDRGFISVGLSGLHGTTLRIPLKGMWFNNGPEEGGCVPLSGLEIKSSDTISAHMEGEDLVLRDIRFSGSAEGIGFVRIMLPDCHGDKEGNFIGVRCLTNGDKVFYRARGSFPVSRPAPPTDLMVGESIRIDVTQDRRVFDLKVVEGDNMRVQVWRRSRVAIGPGGAVSDRKVVSQWRWRNPNDENGGVFHFTGWTCLIRAKRRVGRVWSRWEYFHIDPRRTLCLLPSRQRRT